jgi:hypothetical protein
MYMIHIRGNRDKMVIAYAAISGIVNIYIHGTYVILNGAYSVSQRLHEWEFTLWSHFGTVDQRSVVLLSPFFGS